MNTMTSNRQDRMANPQTFQNISKLDNTHVRRLSHFDIERNFLKEINFGCDTSEQFCSKKDIKLYSQNNYCSAIYCNIRSLSANSDDLTMLFSYICYPFNVIGFSETRTEQDICNTSLSLAMFIYHN